MINEVFFFDSYAVIEVLNGNLNYKRYIDSGILLTKLNLFEVYYGILREVGEAAAEDFIKGYYPCVTDFDQEVISYASKFRLKFRKRNLSMTDCIGYVLANKLGIKFLTGDKEFRDMPNVEFVK